MSVLFARVFRALVTTLFLTASADAFATPTPSTSGQLRTVLVTGGAGYIGSHTCLELINAGNYRVVVIDTLDNSSEESLNRVKQLTGCAPDRLHFRNCDIRDRDGLCKGESADLSDPTMSSYYCYAMICPNNKLLCCHDRQRMNSGPSLNPLHFCIFNCICSVLDEFPDVSSCVHFAGLKAVGESVSKPLAYYDCNVGGTTALLEILRSRNIVNFVFSSSATVYGEPEELPLRETARLQATSPYGRTKLFIEEILRDCYASDPSWNILILRYFNPIGAHSSGKIGEDPHGIPNNLMVGHNFCSK